MEGIPDVAASGEGVVREDGVLASEVASLRKRNVRLLERVHSAKREKEEVKKEVQEVRSRYHSELAKVQLLKGGVKRTKRECQILKERDVSRLKALEDCDRQIKIANRNARKNRAQKLKRESKLKQVREELRLSVEALQEAQGSSSDPEQKEELERCRKEVEDVRKRMSAMSKLEDVEKKEKQHKRENEKRQQKMCRLMAQKRRVLNRDRFRLAREIVKRKKLSDESSSKSDVIAELRKEVRQLKDKLHDDVRPHSFKQGTTYVSSVRGVYQDLMNNHNVSNKNCEGVVRTVLEGLTDMDIKNVSLPKRNTAANMLIEGRKLAQVQTARTLAEGEDMTIASGATTKFGHHYSTYGIYTGSQVWTARRLNINSDNWYA